MRIHKPRAKKKMPHMKKLGKGPQHVLVLLLSHGKEEGKESGRSLSRIAIAISVSLLTFDVKERKLLIDG
jgi:hypothetical protein